ncbi:hypothetical protein GCM10010309_78820 [Streptomyces violaceochromogenes]|nr:hypothetical protein GCM10010309_78820 [Streptomyces violaceochromogenes]
MQVAADGAAITEGPVPAHEELEESSEELDDEISLPVPEVLEGELAALSEALINEELAKEPFVAPDPAESAAEADAKCRARLAAVITRGDDAPVACTFWNTTASVSQPRAAVDAWPTLPTGPDQAARTRPWAKAPAQLYKCQQDCCYRPESF